MYPHLVLTLVLAAAPFTQATPATQKPATQTGRGQARAARCEGRSHRRDCRHRGHEVQHDDITAKPGEQLRVRLVVKGAMPKIAMAHNFVLLTKGAKVVDFATAAMSAQATGFIPADKKADILANTGLAGAGETVEVTFKVPAAAGEYPFICTFPGHFQAGMKGTLVVK